VCCQLATSSENLVASTQFLVALATSESQFRALLLTLFWHGSMKPNNSRNSSNFVEQENQKQLRHYTLYQGQSIMDLGHVVHAFKVRKSLLEAIKNTCG